MGARLGGVVVRLELDGRREQPLRVPPGLGDRGFGARGEGEAGRGAERARPGRGLGGMVLGLGPLRARGMREGRQRVQHGEVPEPVVVLRVARGQVGEQDRLAEHAAPVLDLTQEPQCLADPQRLTASGPVHRGPQVLGGAVEVVGPQPDQAPGDQALQAGLVAGLADVGQQGQRGRAVAGQCHSHRPGEPGEAAHPRFGGSSRHGGGAVFGHFRIGQRENTDDGELRGDAGPQIGDRPVRRRHGPARRGRPGTGPPHRRCGRSAGSGRPARSRATARWARRPVRPRTRARRWRPRPPATTRPSPASG